MGSKDAVLDLVLSLYWMSARDLEFELLERKEKKGSLKNNSASDPQLSPTSIYKSGPWPPYPLTYR